MESAVRLIDLAAGRMTAGEALLGRLELAPAAIALGRDLDALRWLDDGQASLLDERQLLVDRLEKICAIARACSRLPWESAERRLRDLHLQLPLISDSMNANSHYCLAVLEFFDAIAAACVGEPTPRRHRASAPACRPR